MQNDELVAALENGEVSDGDNSGTTAETEYKFIVFCAGDKKYALPAGSVKEILINQELYYLPFVPDWICGLLNFHGEPSVVVDLLLLFTGEAQEDARKFLVLNEQDGQLAFKVQDVAEITKVVSSRINDYPSSGDGELFSSLISTASGEVAVVSLEAIVEKIRSEV